MGQVVYTIVKNGTGMYTPTSFKKINHINMYIAFQKIKNEDLHKIVFIVLTLVYPD